MTPVEPSFIYKYLQSFFDIPSTCARWDTFWEQSLPPIHNMTGQIWPDLRLCRNPRDNDGFFLYSAVLPVQLHHIVYITYGRALIAFQRFLHAFSCLNNTLVPDRRSSTRFSTEQ